MLNLILSVLFSLLALASYGYCLSGIFALFYGGTIVSAIIHFVLLIIPYLLYRLALRYSTNLLSNIFVKFLIPVAGIFYLVNSILALFNIIILALPF